MERSMSFLSIRYKTTGVFIRASGKQSTCECAGAMATVAGEVPVSGRVRSERKYVIIILGTALLIAVSDQPSALSFSS